MPVLRLSLFNSERWRWLYYVDDKRRRVRHDTLTEWSRPTWATPADLHRNGMDGVIIMRALFHYTREQWSRIFSALTNISRTFPLREKSLQTHTACVYRGHHDYPSHRESCPLYFVFFAFVVFSFLLQFMAQPLKARLTTQSPIDDTRRIYRSRIRFCE